jgi:hypothetical protein
MTQQAMGTVARKSGVHYVRRGDRVDLLVCDGGISMPGTPFFISDDNNIRTSSICQAPIKKLSQLYYIDPIDYLWFVVGCM